VREGEGWSIRMGSGRIKTDLESVLKRCGDVCSGHAGISPSFEQVRK
jgi:hypothetical protein